MIAHADTYRASVEEFHRFGEVFRQPAADRYLAHQRFQGGENVAPARFPEHFAAVDEVIP